MAKEISKTSATKTTGTAKRASKAELKVAVKKPSKAPTKGLPINASPRAIKALADREDAAKKPAAKRATTVNIEEVKSMLNSVKDKVGAARAKEIVKEFGKADKVAAIDPVNFGKVIDACRAELAPPKRNDALFPADAKRKEAGPKKHEIKNLKGLREVLDQYPKATGYTVASLLDHEAIYLTNTRGRVIADVLLAKKPSVKKTLRG